MARNPFSSAPSGSSIGDAIGGAANLQWSLNTLFGTDPTTLAIKQQTAFANKQAEYERNVALVENVYGNCCELLNQCVSIFEQSKEIVPTNFSLDFLIEEHERCDLAVDEFRNVTIQYLISGNSKAAAKYYASEIAPTVQPLAMHRANLESMNNISSGLYLQWVEATTTFKNKENLENFETGYGGRWANLITKLNKLEELNPAEYPKVQEEMAIAHEVGLANENLFRDSYQLVDELWIKSIEVWESFKELIPMSDEDAEVIGTLITQLEHNSAQWLANHKIMLSAIEKFETKLSGVSLAIQVEGVTHSPQKPLKTRLLELDELLEDGIINQEEYADLRKKALDSFN